MIASLSQPAGRQNNALREGRASKIPQLGKKLGIFVYSGGNIA